LMTGSSALEGGAEVVIVSACRASGEALASVCRRRGMTVKVTEHIGTALDASSMLVLDLTSDSAGQPAPPWHALDSRRAVVIGDASLRLPHPQVSGRVDPSATIEQLTHAVRSARAEAIGGQSASTGGAHVAPDILTDREREVLRELLIHGDTKLVAAELGITELTLRAHLRNLFPKLGVKSRAEAAAWAIREGLGPLEPQGGR
jgi:DNA-binding CsgD family transcriptional regulator